MQNSNQDFVETISEQFQKYLKILSGTGIVLMLATAIALIWANSPLAHYYEELWHHTNFSIGLGNFKLEKHLIHWINDGLMAIFFFVVGIEIKREIVAGELNSLKKATLPIIAAVGGMVVPIIIFLLFGLEGESARGWGVPMATDIAFSIGVLALLGSRVPITVKVFLTALAIVDDLGAVMVIALFYTHTINWMFLLIGFALVIALFIYNRLNGYNLWIYTGLGLITWFLFLQSGVHATIAGVLVAFTIPVYPRIKSKEFILELKEQIQEYTNNKSCVRKGILSPNQYENVDRIGTLSRKVQSPLQFIEHDLSGWVNYLILPVFALANAGVDFYDDKRLAANDSINSLGMAIGVSLVVGKLIGISFFSWLSIKLKLVEKPKNMNLMTLIGVGLLGGIGFTMSTFIATLAFDDMNVLNTAKIGIFVGSLIAGISGYIILKLSLKKVKS